ncbi:MAG: hypothetical protein IJZ57_04290 [Clostridia bacterium]|nr:hypothetical protein [Clostridia bacterium]
MKISDSGEFIFSLTSPETVKGVIFTVLDNSTKTTFDETTVTGADNVFSELYKAVNLLKDAKEFSKVADGYLFKSEDFTAELDFQGNLKKLNTAKGEFYFK